MLRMSTAFQAVLSIFFGMRRVTLNYDYVNNHATRHKVLKTSRVPMCMSHIIITLINMQRVTKS